MCAANTCPRDPTVTLVKDDPAGRITLKLRAKHARVYEQLGYRQANDGRAVSA